TWHQSGTASVWGRPRPRVDSFRRIETFPIISTKSLEQMNGRSQQDECAGRYGHPVDGSTLVIEEEQSPQKQRGLRREFVQPRHIQESRLAIGQNHDGETPEHCPAGTESEGSRLIVRTSLQKRSETPRVDL